MAMTVKEIVQLKREFHRPYTWLCQAVGIPYPSFKRYQARIALNQPVIFPAGPKKVEPLRLEELMVDIQQLSHVQKRTVGTTELYARYSERISRREFNRIVAWVRCELNREKRSRLRRISWNRARLVWSMDETELGCNGGKVRLLHIQDLGSRYKFAPLAAQQISAEQVAAKLEELFTSHGAPVVLKRDNGPALNGQAVDRVLGKHLVIPLNSPAYYPPYNGGMERAQRELKRRLLPKLSSFVGHDCGLLEAYAAQAAGELNHSRRRSLGGRDSCQVFQTGIVAIRPYTRRKRKEVFDWIKNLAVRIVAELNSGDSRQASAAWRIAVETWLRRNGIISVSPGNSVTLFRHKNGS
jgi:transposase InsO family protein